MCRYAQREQAKVRRPGGHKFLCTICKESFPTEDAWERHFDRKHHLDHDPVRIFQEPLGLLFFVPKQPQHAMLPVSASYHRVNGREKMFASMELLLTNNSPGGCVNLYIMRTKAHQSAPKFTRLAKCLPGINLLTDSCYYRGEMCVWRTIASCSTAIGST